MRRALRVSNFTLEFEPDSGQFGPKRRNDTLYSTSKNTDASSFHTHLTEATASKPQTFVIRKLKR